MTIERPMLEVVLGRVFFGESSSVLLRPRRCKVVGGFEAGWCVLYSKLAEEETGAL